MKYATVLLLFVVLPLQALGGMFDSTFNQLAADSAQSFSAQVAAAKTASDAKSAIEFYTQMEQNFLKMKSKGMEKPIADFRAKCAPSLARLKTDFNVKPEYSRFDNFMHSLIE